MEFYNRTTGKTASTIGVLLAMSSILNHGIFEILQGGSKTGGLFIEAIGKDHRFWEYGTEGAFTIMPSFIAAGISVILLGAILIIWSLFFIHKKYGTITFASIFVALTMVGGGLGYVVFFIPNIIFMTRMHKPLTKFDKVLGKHLRRRLSKLWLPMLVVMSLSWLVVMELGIFGYVPGMTDPDMIMNVVFIFLLVTVVSTIITFICAISKDLDKRSSKSTTNENTT